MSDQVPADDDLTIAPAVAADRPALLALLAAQLAEHDIPLEAARLANAIDGALADPTRAELLMARAAADGVAIGVAYVSYIWALEHGGLSAWLEELYVVPARRDHGIGRRLVAAVLALARARGCAAVDLEVEADHTRAANLYARTGFTPHTRARWIHRLR